MRNSRVLLLVGDPARLPVGGDAEPEPVRVDFLTHYLRPLSASSSAVVGRRRPRPRRRVVASSASTLVVASLALRLDGSSISSCSSTFVIVVVIVLRARPRACTRAAHALGAPALRDRRARAGRLVAAAALLELVGVEAGEHDRDVRRALADPEVAAAGTGLAPLAGRAFVAPRAARRTARRPGCCWLCSALAIAESSSFNTSSAASFSHSCSTRLGVVDRQAAHEVEHLADLVRRDVQVADGRARALGRVGRARHQRRLDRSWPAWYRNVRVGANSPSLWPTIASVTYTGTCLRPSCTAIV